MIKKFEQFTKLNEKHKFNTRAYTYLEIHCDLCLECAKSHIDTLIKKGGRIELDRPKKMTFFKECDCDYTNMSSLNVVAFELSTQEDIDIFADMCDETMLYKDEDYNFVVAIGEEGYRMPVDYWTCPSDFIFEIDSEFDEYI